MKFVTIDVNIDDGKIVPVEPREPPRHAKGVLSFLAAEGGTERPGEARRVKLPLIKGDGRTFINPSPEQLDESAWDD